MVCPDDNALLAWIHGSISDSGAMQLEAHTSSCESCRELISELLSRGTFPTLSSDRSGALHAPPPPRGPQLQRYELLEVIGRGGMAVVHAARDRELGRRVCLKMLLPAASGPQAEALAERLRAEARTLAQLTHPNVVTVHDVGSWERQLYLVMEHVDGGTLREWLADGKRSEEEVLERFFAAGEGLAAAHVAGIVHRDFKPANVLLGTDGRVRVADFGLSQMAENAQTTLSGEPVAGTPAYMSPEQLAGAPADFASDQFSFCVALFEALEGRRPFRGWTLKQLRAATLSEPLQPANPRVPERVKQALLRGLRPDPRQRFPSMRELLAALRPPAPKRRAGWAWATAAVALGVAGAFGVVERLRVHRLQRCTVEGATVTKVWNDGVRQHISRTLEGVAAAPVLARLDAYALGWTRARTAACEAATAGEGPASPVHAAVAECLSARLRDLSGLASRLTSLEPALRGRALPAVLSLTAIDECSQAVPRNVLVPDEVKLRAPVVRLRHALEGLNLDIELGLAKTALLQLDAVAAEAEQIGFAPLLAEVAWMRGRTSYELKGGPEAAEAFRRAVVLAQAYGDDLLAAKAWTWRLISLPVQGALPALEMELATAAVERAGRPPRVLMELEVGLGNLAEKAEDSETARIHFERAAAIAQLERGTLRSAQLLSSLGVALRGLDRRDEAIALHRRAVQQLEAMLGKDHLELGNPLNNLALVLFERGQSQEGFRALRRAVTLLEEWGDPDGERLAVMRGILGLMLVREGEREGLSHLEKAGRHFEGGGSTYARLSAFAQLGYGRYVFADRRDGLRLMEESLAGAVAAFGKDSLQQVGVLSTMCRIAGDGPGGGRGIWACQRMLALYQASDQRDPLVRLFPTAMLGRAALRRGRRAEAAALLKEALEARTRAFSAPDDQADLLRRELDAALGRRG